VINKETDVLIVGGGLTGATLMLALQQLGIRSLLVDAQGFEDKIRPDFDARSLALSPASQRILSMLGLWDRLQARATAIEFIHVSDQYHFGATRFRGKPHAPLGYVVEMQYINAALQQLLNPEHSLAPATVCALDQATQTLTVTMEKEEVHIKAQLIVAADGAHSAIRRFCVLSERIKQYEQQAIVTNIGLANAHQGRAYERFTTHGPLALLPMQENRMSLVWAMPPKEAQQLMSVPDTDFLSQLHQAFGYRLGRFTKVGKRFSFPLYQVLMKQQVKDKIVFIGNAAHTLHPVAGQGFNLGLRDVATLAQCIARQGLTPEMLQNYVNLRSQDQKIITCLTDGLINVFTARLPGLGLVRGVGLIALDNIAALKNLLARYAGGFGGVLPDLVCEIALTEQP
jgi:2-octaprenyl-6-methoxyphenol hydroxylase